MTKSPNAFDFRPEVLPDNKTVIFERRFENIMKSRLMKTTTDGGNTEEIFPESETNNAFPKISRDGKWLAYTAQSINVENLDFKSVLKIAEIKQGKFTPLEKEINTDTGYQYEWAGDNKTLYFVDRKGIPNVFTATADGKGQPKPISNFNSGTILNFGFLPAAKRLFLVRGIVNSDLILIKDGSKATQK